MAPTLPDEFDDEPLPAESPVVAEEVTSEVLDEYRQVREQLQRRWPENKIAPDLARIEALMDLLGRPQTSAPVIHIAGTNGKSSTARMTECLLRSFGLTTGLFTSPDLGDIRQRISLNGQPISEQRFSEVYRDVEPYVAMVDAESAAHGGPEMTMFEILTALAFACFADAPVDVMVIEVGMGGRWDATNVVEPDVAVVTPIGLDHVDYLGGSLTSIAVEKSGIIKPGSEVVLAGQSPEAAAVLLARCADVGQAPVREGSEFGVQQRHVAVGGQMITLFTPRGTYQGVFLPVHGVHQSTNAAVALAAVEAFLGSEATGRAGSARLNPDVIREGFATVESPARLERVASDPVVIVDGAHNRHAMDAIAVALGEAFAFDHTIAIVGVMADKDVEQIAPAVGAFASTIIATTNPTSRGLPAAQLAERVAAGLTARPAADRPTIEVVDRPHQALEVARAHARELPDETTVGIVVTGSIMLAGAVRALVRVQQGL